MENYQALQKIIKKGKKIEDPKTLLESLHKQISETSNDRNTRELNFLTLYYGLQGKALTLENIGSSQEQPLTRERVRQIINSVLNSLKNNDYQFENPYKKAKEIFQTLIQANSFIRIEELLSNDLFTGFKNNVKGLISFLNDCDIRQIAYRKSYYFYPKTINRKIVTNEIQKENKLLRREHTLEKMSLKAKTVTYVPNEIREHLLDYAHKKEINLNPLYENILESFMKEKPYNKTDYIFAKTKSWKARKGKAQWQQIGIYIDRDVFDQIKIDVNKIKSNLAKNVSLMSFISQAFVWHYENNNKS